MIEEGVGTRAKIILTFIRAPALAGFSRKLVGGVRCDIPLSKQMQPMRLCNKNYEDEEYSKRVCDSTQRDAKQII